MRKNTFLLAIAATATLTLLSPRVGAETDADEMSELPALGAANAAEANSEAEPVTVPVSVTAQDAPLYAVCLAGDHSGIARPSARTAFAIVCDALRRAGAPVGGMAEGPVEATTAYRMELQRLDRAIILRVTYENPVGTPRDSRSLTLSSLDEVLVGADRISEALVSGKRIEETATVDNLVGNETRKYQKKSGETFVGLGLYGLAVPAVDVYSGAGLEFAGFYETPSFAVGGSIRFAVGGGGEYEKRATYGAVSLGGRGFFGEGDIAPYLGGGLAFAWIDLKEWNETRGFHGEAEGFAAFAETGIEMLRLHKSRFLIGVRVDVPFFSAKETTYGSPRLATGDYTKETSRRYAIPVSLNATFML